METSIPMYPDFRMWNKFMYLIRHLENTWNTRSLTTHIIRTKYTTIDCNILINRQLSISIHITHKHIHTHYKGGLYTTHLDKVHKTIPLRLIHINTHRKLHKDLLIIIC